LPGERVSPFVFLKIGEGKTAFFVYFTLKVYQYFNPKVYQFKINSKLVLSFLGYPKNHKTGALILVDADVFISHPSYLWFVSVGTIPGLSQK
jgi:hypothetical protein